MSSEVKQIGGKKFDMVHVDEAVSMAEQLVGENGKVTNLHAGKDKTTFDVVPKEPECRVTTKQGDLFTLDLSASRIKRLRREKKLLDMKDDKGKKFALNCAKITSITPLT